MTTNVNIILIVAASILAFIAVYALYAIIMYKGTKHKDAELQITTKNVLEQVKILFDKGEYPLVILLASEYLARVPSHRKVRNYLAKAFYKDGKYNNSIKHCQIVLKKDPYNIDTHRTLGDCYIKKQMYGKAIKEYEIIFDRNRKDKEVVKTLAKLYKDTDQIYYAVSVYNDLVELIDNNEEMAEVQLILAELNEEAHDYPAAFEAYKSRLEIYPNDVSTNQKLASLYIKINNQQKAIETLQYMITITDDARMLLWVYENLVEMFVSAENYEDAISCSEKLLELQGSDKFRVRNNIATYKIKLNQLDDGVSILEDLVMMSQNQYDVTIELAKTYIAQKEYKKALDNYLILLDKASQNEAKEVRSLICELYIEWAKAEVSKGDFEKSYEYLESAMQYNMINPEVYFTIAQNKVKQKLHSDSLEFFQKALEYDKGKENHVKYLLELSDVHQVLGNFFEEKKALTDLLKIDEKNPMGLYRVGYMQLAQHDIKSAEESFLKALEYDPELLDAKFNLATIYEYSDKQKAKDLYIEILDIDPSYEKAKNALQELNSNEI